MTPAPILPPPVEMNPPRAHAEPKEYMMQQEPQEEEEEEDHVSEEESDTGSVIRHKIEYSDDDEEYESGSDDEEYEGDDRETERSLSPVAESIATIRAPGGKLKTRSSSTPADIAQMAATRRLVSGDQSNPPPPVPRIPNGYRSEGESGTGSEDEEDEEEEEEEDEVAEGHSDNEGRRVSGPRRRKISNTLPALGEFEFDLKLDDLNEEFDRVIEKQKVFLPTAGLSRLILTTKSVAI